METNRLWVCSHRRAGKVSLSVMVFPWDLLTINTLQINTNPVFFKSWMEVNLPVLHSDLKKKKKVRMQVGCLLINSIVVDGGDLYRHVSRLL